MLTGKTARRFLDMVESTEPGTVDFSEQFKGLDRIMGKHKKVSLASQLTARALLHGYELDEVAIAKLPEETLRDLNALVRSVPEGCDQEEGAEVTIRFRLGGEGDRLKDLQDAPLLRRVVCDLLQEIRSSLKHQAPFAGVPLLESKDPPAPENQLELNLGDRRSYAGTNKVLNVDKDQIVEALGQWLREALHGIDMEDW